MALAKLNRIEIAYGALPASAKSAVNVVIGGLSIAVVCTGAWLLLSGIGSLVTHLTIWLGGRPGMWSINSVFGVVNDPTYVGVAIGFLFCLVSTVALSTAVVLLLAELGTSVIGSIRSRYE